MSTREIDVLISPNSNPAQARITSPIITIGRIPIFATNIPQITEAIKHPAPLGTIEIPLKNAVYPKRD